MRLLLLFLFLAAVVLTSFFLWGDPLMQTFSLEGSIGWLGTFGSWAWAMGIALLMADLLLPLPATLVMSALGYIYGALTGGFIAGLGSFAAGALGYWLCRLIGENAAVKILGQKDFDRGKHISANVGGWLVVLSRWLPVFPEVVACMAGMVRMPPVYFHLALAAGSLPMGFIYAYIGHSGVENPILAVVLSAGLPPLLWWSIRFILKKKLA